MTDQKLYRQLKTGIVIIFYLFTFLFFFFHANGNLDPDLGWHVRVGQDILSDKAVPSVEKYNFPILGQTWVDHEWLANLVSFLIYDRTGYIGLTAFFAFVFTLTLMIQHYWLIRKYRADQGFAFLSLAIIIIQFFGSIAMLQQAGVRLQMLTLPFLMTELIILDVYAKNGKWTALLPLALLFIVWANIHGSFLIGLFVLLLWGVVNFAEAFVGSGKKFTSFDNRKSVAIRYFLFLPIPFLATLLTPYGLSLFAFLSDYTDPYYRHTITEWLPAWENPVSGAAVAYLAFITTILIAAYHRLLKQGKQTIDIWLLVSTTVFLLLAFESKRHFPLLFVMSFPFLIWFLMIPGQVVPVMSKLYLKRANLVPFSLVFILGFLLMILQVGARLEPVGDPFSAEQNCIKYPCEAVEFLKNSPFRDRNLLNLYGWGGFLQVIWPEKLLFIDGRQPQRKFDDHTFLKEYRLFWDKEHVAKKLDTYAIGVVLINNAIAEKPTLFSKYVLRSELLEKSAQNDALRTYLVSSGQWELKYEDKTSSVYIRK